MTMNPAVCFVYLVPLPGFIDIGIPLTLSKSFRERGIYVMNLDLHADSFPIYNEYGKLFSSGIGDTDTHEMTGSIFTWSS